MKANLTKLLVVGFLISPLVANAQNAEAVYKKAFTLNAGGGTTVEFKNFSANGRSAILLSLAMREWTNESDWSSYNAIIGDYEYYHSHTKTSEYGIGLGWRNYLTRSSFSTFWDSNLIYSFTRSIENYSNSAEEFREYQKGVDLNLMYGAEYKFSNSFAMEGSFGVVVNFIRNTATGYNGGDTNSIGTKNSGVRVSFYF